MNTEQAIQDDEKLIEFFNKSPVQVVIFSLLFGVAGILTIIITKAASPIESQSVNEQSLIGDSSVIEQTGLEELKRIKTLE